MPSMVAVISPALLALLLTATTAAQLKVRRQPDSSCGCYNWKDLYATKKIFCGMGLEYGEQTAPNYPRSADAFLETASHTRRKWETEFPRVCEEFFHRHNSSACVRVSSAGVDSAEKWYERSWCYVSSTCTHTNAYSIPKSKSYKAKICTEGEDQLLADLSVPELFKYAKEQHFRQRAMLPRFAYPSEKSLYYSQYENASLHEAELRRMMDAGEPIIMDDEMSLDAAFAQERKEREKELEEQGVVYHDSIRDALQRLDNQHKDLKKNNHEVIDQIIVDGGKVWRVSVDKDEFKELGPEFLECEKGC